MVDGVSLWTSSNELSDDHCDSLIFTDVVVMLTEREDQKRKADQKKKMMMMKSVDHLELVPRHLMKTKKKIQFLVVVFQFHQKEHQREDRDACEEGRKDRRLWEGWERPHHRERALRTREHRDGFVCLQVWEASRHAEDFRRGGDERG